MKQLVLQLAALLGAVAAVVLTSALPAYGLAHFADRLPRVDPHFTIFAAQFVVLAVLFVALRVRVTALAGGLALATGLRAVAWLVIGTLMFSLLVSTTIVLTGAGNAQAGFAYTVARLTSDYPRTGLAGYFALMVIVVPLFEELLFRVVILGHLLRRWPPWLALATSSALFMSGHSSWILSGLGGLAYGLLYLRFRNLWLCFAAHAAHNLFSAGGATLLVIYLHDRRYLMPTGDNIFLLQLVWFAVVIACFALFLRYVFAGVEGGARGLLLPRRSPPAEAAAA